MTTNFARAPHQGRTVPIQAAPNAALLIDFDNVTMGIRSDLTKELKNLLNSDIIKGKVAVQRAYADWRRYPQYIVPLSEASVDLIFAPAYGSSKKNATDIRLAIDALELVFTRPEIGTFILLSGDSDFSSMVLKLKEYGKYVIGVGIRESSSDLLVQNCDEYYSYSALTGLTRAGDEVVENEDPWVLVERAVRQMAERGDVMRSDRLKQVMVEIDPTFDEKALGFSKYNRFLSEAATRGCLSIKKMENGQYDVAPPGEDSAERGERERRGRERGRERRESRESRESKGSAREGREPREGREGREAREGRESSRETRESRGATAEAKGAATPEPAVEPAAAPAASSRSRAAGSGGSGGSGGIGAAYDLLRRAVADLAAERGGAVRDSDVKRRMLESEPNWDESTLGFPKFSRFLRQAHADEVIDLRRSENGAYDIELRGGAPLRVETAAAEGGLGRAGREAAEEASSAAVERSAARESRRSPEPREEAVQAAAAGEAAGAAAEESGARSEPTVGRGVSPYRRGSRRGTPEGPPPLLPGQAVHLPGADGGEAATAVPEGVAATDPPADPSRLGLPTDRDSVLNYLQNRYKGVGLKTAEVLVDAFGAENVFGTLREDPERVREVLGARRADAVLDGWAVDFERRRARRGGGSPEAAEEAAEAGASVSSSAGSTPAAKRSRRGGRGRGGRGRARKPTGDGGDAAE